VVDEELGTKRTCPSCATRFYDLNKDPIVCPSCDESFIVDPILPSKTDSPAPAKPVEEEKAAEKDDDKVEIISLDDAEDTDVDDDDDEAAAIKDVDLGTDVEINDDSDDDTFLEDDEDDDAPVTGLIGGAAKKDDE
jgi:uncharacterized protein (TIGR02300 family)